MHSTVVITSISCTIWAHHLYIQSFYIKTVDLNSSCLLVQSPHFFILHMMSTVCLLTAHIFPALCTHAAGFTDLLHNYAPSEIQVNPFTFAYVQKNVSVFSLEQTNVSICLCIVQNQLQHWQKVWGHRFLHWHVIQNQS